VKNLSTAHPAIDRQDRALQERERRLGGIQLPKPATERGWVRYTIGIFDRWCGCFPGTAIDKVAPQRFTASDKAVVSVRKREHGQEGNRLTANTAETPPNSDPVVVLVMGLFPPTAMTYDRFASTNRAPAKDPFCSGLRPIDCGLAPRCGKCDKDNRGNGALPRGDLAKIPTRVEPSPPSKIFDWKRISNPRRARYFDN
jgi:hypothetical protein